MIGIIYLLAFLVYLFISVVIILYSSKKAKERGIAGWKWGVPAALIMYLIVFWDHIPTIVAHKYYCDKDAGLKIYKSLGQWKVENPGVAKTLTHEEKVKSEKYKNQTIYYLNQRFNFIVLRTPIFLSIKRHTQRIVDKLDKNILAEYIDYSSGGGFQNAKTLTDYKPWLLINTCDKGRVNRSLFSKYLSMAKRIGDLNHEHK